MFGQTLITTDLRFCMLVCDWSIWHICFYLPLAQRDAWNWKCTSHISTCTTFWICAEVIQNFSIVMVIGCILNQKLRMKIATSLLRNLTWNICSIQIHCFFLMLSPWQHVFMGKCTDWSCYRLPPTKQYNQYVRRSCLSYLIVNWL